MIDIVDQLRMRHLQQPCSDGESVYSQAADEIVRLRAALAVSQTRAESAEDDAGEADYHLAVWKAVAIALNSRLADEVSDPTCAATLAYNAARNGRMAEAFVWAAEAVKAP